MGPTPDLSSSRKDDSGAYLDSIVGHEEVLFPELTPCEVIDFEYCIVAKAVFYRNEN